MTAFAGGNGAAVFSSNTETVGALAKGGNLTLNNGVAMPALGFGVYQSSPEDTLSSVQTALRTGYRLIDTAAAYMNEAQVGEAVRASGLRREEVFVESKLWISDYTYDGALHGFDRSLRNLGMDGLCGSVSAAPTRDRRIRAQGLPTCFHLFERGETSACQAVISAA